MKTLLLVLSFLNSNLVFAWGPVGHRTVGEIAEKHLTPKVLARTQQLLSNQSLARVSTWADEIKSDPTNFQHTFCWHYTTWPEGSSSHSSEHETPETGTLLKSIQEQLNILKDNRGTETQKSVALKFLVHLVGDLHMPLHVGNGTDQGGNLCKVTFMGRNTNLHAVWDEGMISATDLSFTELARFILEDKSSKDLQLARAGQVIDWALESKKLTESLYPFESTPGVAVGGTKNYCKKDAPAEDMPKLSYEYSFRFMPIVQQRLYQAGVRLAALLNSHL
jgi:hypothetical protein